MPKLSFVGNFELHVYVSEDSKTKKSNVDNDFRTWCLLCLHCKVVKPFNGIGVFYGRFVKDFSTHMSLVDGVVINDIKLHRSHVCGIILKLLEHLCGGNLETFLLILDVASHKSPMHDVVLTLHVVHEGIWMHFSYIFDHFLKLLGQLSEIPCNKLGLLVETLSCKLNVNYHKPPLYSDQEFVNLWKRTSYLSKNDVSMVPYGVRNPDLRANPFQEVENDMTMSARHQVSSPRREPWIDWGPRKSVKKCQGFNKARGSPEDARNREGLDLRTNPFQEGEDDTIIEAVRQGFQLQLDSTRNRPIEMISESYETTIIVFVLEIASRGYLAHLNRSPNEGVMAVLQKSRKTGEGVQREHPPWRGSPERTPGRVFCTLQFTRPGESPET
ncbi:uncharacterized protein LOC125218183 isoform X4 [Salvia hispanica]|uniref:uncharacterized protein LOC125218183 isoform X4 n=1 Tax=Salvia hispanica TaxID=49212 RepID=UPI002009A06C|nr:uncharacterized protein LOC125218183 isoform X4 [Salvia hispanica]